MNIRKATPFRHKSFIFKRAITFSLAILMAASTPISSYAAVDDFIDKFAANNIMFYDPDECSDQCTKTNAGEYSGDGSDITWIGDSISNMSESIIKEKVPKADLHTQVSKHFWMDASSSAGGDSGTTILEDLSGQGKVRKILIFALGTNDPNAVNTEQIKKVIQLASNATRIVFTTNHTTKANYDTNNSNFKSIADNDSKVALADWQKLIQGKEDQYLSSDGVHPKDNDAMEAFVSEILSVAGGGTTTSTTIDKGEAIANHSTITFYGSGADENGGNAGQNASEDYNEGKLAEGQVAISNSDPTLNLGDVIYVETDKSGEGSAANEKFFIVTDKGAGDGGVSGNYNVDVFHDPASENTSSPYGMSNNAKIYKIASGVSWEDYLSKYKDGTTDAAAECSGGGRGNAVIKGDTPEEKIWSGLTSIGFTEEQAAAVLGNMAHEGSLNPVRHEISARNKFWPYDIENGTDHAYGIGLIQWSWTRRPAFLKYIKEQAPDLMHYFKEPEKYDGSGEQFLQAVDSEQDANDLYALSITYVYDEAKENYSGFFDIDDKKS